MHTTYNNEFNIPFSKYWPEENKPLFKPFSKTYSNFDPFPKKNLYYDKSPSFTELLLKTSLNEKPLSERGFLLDNLAQPLYGQVRKVEPRPSPPPDPYAYLTRNVDTAQLFAAVSNLTAGSQKIAVALRNADWDDPVFDDKDFPVFALAALRDNLIGKESFVTAMLYWSALQHHAKSEIEVKRVDEDTFPLLSSTFYKITNGQKKPELTEEQKAKFLRLLSEYPASERCFFVVADLDKNSTKDSSISKALKESANFHIFNRLEIDGETKRMIPSFGMMQAYCQVTGGSSAVTITPTIGLSSKEDIVQNGKNGTRDMGTPFPGHPLPNEADNLPCRLKYDFPLHDFFHAKTVSKVPLFHQRAVIRFSTFVKAQLKQSSDPIEKIFYKEWEERIIDLEAPSYQVVEDKEAAFWMHLNHTVHQTMIRVSNLMVRASYYQAIQTSGKEIYATLQTELANRGLVGKVMKAFMSQQDLFSQFGIGYEFMVGLASAAAKSDQTAQKINVWVQGAKYLF